MKNKIRLAAAAGAVMMLLGGCADKAASLCDSGVESFRASNYTDAVAYFTEAAQQDPENAEYLIYLGLAQAELGYYEEAKENFEKVLSADPDNRAALRGIGIIYYQQNDITLAADRFLKVINLSGGSVDGVCLDAMKYYGNCLLLQKNYEEAVEMFSAVLENGNKEKMADIYYLRGCAYIALENENDAVLDFESSLALEPDDYEIYCNMYLAFMEAGYVDRAESYLKRIINMEGTDDLLIGKIYYFLSKYDEAETYLVKAYDEKMEDAAYLLAMTYEAQGNYTEAEAFYQSYMSAHPNDANIYNQYAAYLIGRGKYENALVYIETGLELESDDAQEPLLFNQAVCYEFMGDYEQAKVLFEAYLEQFPNDKAAIKEYQFLESR